MVCLDMCVKISGPHRKALFPGIEVYPKGKNVPGKACVSRPVASGLSLRVSPTVILPKISVLAAVSPLF